MSPGSGRTSLSKSSPDRGATTPILGHLAIFQLAPEEPGIGYRAPTTGPWGSSTGPAPEPLEAAIRPPRGAGSASASASRRVAAGARPASLSGGAITASSPCLAASSRRRSGWPTQRSSPVSPSSPKQRAAGRAAAAARPRLRAGDGQRDRQVAAGLVHAHAADDVHEHVRSRRCRRRRGGARIASTSARRLRSRPETTRRGCSSSERRDQRLHLDEQRPRALHRREHDAAGGARGLGDEARGGVEHLDQAALAHLEQPRLVGRAEAVLQRAQLAVGALALALELQHAVDEVLEHARAGQRAVLGDVADEDHRDAARLGELHDLRGDLAHLADRARRAGQLAGAQRLHGVDHAHLRALGGERVEHRLEVGLGERSAPRAQARPRPATARRGSAAASRSARSLTCSADSSPLTYSVLCPRRRGGRAPCS